MKITFFKCVLIFASLLPNLAMSQTPKEGSTDRPTFVLVHGTFQWGGQWDPLSAILRKEGYSVHAPTLSGLGERNHLLSKQIGLSTHIQDVVNHITWYDLDNVILVGHSYGGGPITGVADDVPERIAHIVYIDTAPFDHGENLLDVFGTAETVSEAEDQFVDGWLIPPKLLRNPPPPTMSNHPVKTYTDRMCLAGTPPKAGTIILATEAEEEFGYLRKEKAPRKAKDRGWALHIVEGPHPLQDTSPSKEKVAEILLGIAGSLKQP